MIDRKPSVFAEFGPEDSYRSQKFSACARARSSLSRFDPAAASVALMASPM